MKQILWLIMAIALPRPSLAEHKEQVVTEVSKLSPTKVLNILKPKSIKQLQAIIQQTKTPVSFAGGRFSQGGQIAYPHGLTIDMTNFNKIIHFDPKAQIITVQTGIRWSEIQTHIDPYGLSVKIMQSYNDFTVGGSLSVNVHGRDPLGSLIKTILSIKIILADGSIKHASSFENSELFNAAIGGYGLLGPIIEVSLRLTSNEKIKREAREMPLEKYSDYFFNHIASNEKIVFHSANLYPNDFSKVLSINWFATNSPLTIPDNMRTHGFYAKEKIQEQLLRRISILKKVRAKKEPNSLTSQEVVWRNYEMSYSVQSLEPIVRYPTTTILQEYFVPTNNLIPFIKMFKNIVREYNINVLNVAIRYVPADKQSLLSYATKDSFALVCYINVLRTKKQTKEREWTQQLINAALSVHGTFYLPYHLYATKEQFQKAYPSYRQFLSIKKELDPDNKFLNSLYSAYLT